MYVVGEGECQDFPYRFVKAQSGGVRERNLSLLPLCHLSPNENFVVVAQSLLVLTHCDPHVPQHIRLPCPSPFPRVCSNSCTLSR